MILMYLHYDCDGNGGTRIESEVCPEGEFNCQASSLISPFTGQLSLSLSALKTPFCTLEISFCRKSQEGCILIDALVILHTVSRGVIPGIRKWQ